MISLPEKPEWLVVGLGNPGNKYKITRHNIGFMAIDLLAEENSVNVDQVKHESLTGILNFKKEDREYKVLLCKPQNFMNNSGESVAALVKEYSISVDRIMIILDDFQLPLGKLRIRPGGSDGGHNGLKSIAECLADQDYPRLRLGIGSENLDQELVSAVDFVLSDFEKCEEESVELIINRAVELIFDWIENGLGYCQNKYN